MAHSPLQVSPPKLCQPTSLYIVTTYYKSAVLVYVDQVGLLLVLMDNSNPSMCVCANQPKRCISFQQRIKKATTYREKGPPLNAPPPLSTFRTFPRKLLFLLSFLQLLLSLQNNSCKIAWEYKNMVKANSGTIICYWKKRCSICREQNKKETEMVKKRRKSS